MKIRYAAISEAGWLAVNEDSYRIIDMQDKNMWTGILCDGLGGHDNGEVASRVVADAIAKYWSESTEMDKIDETDDNKEKVVEACRIAAARLDEEALRLGRSAMGTTMVMAGIRGGKVTIAHLGDSRCYLIRYGHYDYDDILNTEKDHVVYRTADHVRVDFGWEVVERYFFSFSDDRLLPEVVSLDILPGDRLLICSDGVYRSMSSRRLKELLLEDWPPEQILEEIDSLCRRNGDDNYTAIFAIVDDTDI